MTWWTLMWRRAKAWLRWDLRLVCELSEGLGDADYHDWPDDQEMNFPWHMMRHTCTRCGKRFII